MKCIRVLRNQLQQIREGTLPSVLSEGILVQVRQLLEQRPYRQEYSLLTFICHCVVHSDLHNSAVIYMWFSHLSRMLNVPSDEGAEMMAATFGAIARPWVTKAGATVLGIDGLRAEVKAVLSRESLDTLLADRLETWYHFVRGLLSILSEKRIGLHAEETKWSKPARRYVTEMEGAARAYITSIEVFVQGGRFKLIVQLSVSKVRPVFTVSMHSPPIEFESGDVPETDIGAFLANG